MNLKKAIKVIEAFDANFFDHARKAPANKRGDLIAEKCVFWLGKFANIIRRQTNELKECLDHMKVLSGEITLARANGDNFSWGYAYALSEQWGARFDSTLKNSERIQRYASAVNVVFDQILANSRGKISVRIPEGAEEVTIEI